MAQVKVSKWGNSIAIRFPKTVAEAMRLHDGDVVDIQVDNGKATLEKRGLKLAPPLAELVAEMDRLGWENEPETVDWGPDVGSERFYDHD
jgi:antitoxin MazE